MKCNKGFNFHDDFDSWYAVNLQRMLNFKERLIYHHPIVLLGNYHTFEIKRVIQRASRPKYLKSERNHYQNQKLGLN